MREWIKTLINSKNGAYGLSFALLLLVGGAAFFTMGCGSSCGGSSNEMLYDLKQAGVSYSRIESTPKIRMAAAGNQLQMWIDLAASGVITPTTTVLDSLAENGYFAIRVPHAPPDCTDSELKDVKVDFNYFQPPTSLTVTSVPITITRRSDLEAPLNSQYPPGDCAHWEVWWLEEDENFPIPEQPFALNSDRRNFLSFTAKIDFVDADAYDCAGCPLGFIFSNGFVDFDTFETTIQYMDEGAPVSGIVAFGPHCGYLVPELSQSVGQAITSTVSFTHTFCLENWSTEQRTFTVTAASTQDWLYQFSSRAVPGGSPPALQPALPFVVTVDQIDQDTLFPGMLAIQAVYTPTLVNTDSFRETLYLTATSTISSENRATVFSYALAPSYDLEEEGKKEEYFLFLPLVLR